ncbi:MAG: hypothetical protein M3O50_03665, partial [Myxococcota bacterium]|nr:hypothetical protein [Myxococcota bacterium]
MALRACAGGCGRPGMGDGSAGTVAVAGGGVSVAAAADGAACGGSGATMAAAPLGGVERSASWC